MNTLDTAFLNEMRALIGDELDAYLHALHQPPVRGLRVNTLKITPDEFLRRFSAPLAPTGHTENGFYADGLESPGRHPLHHAGLFYMQEPSAMLPVTLTKPYLGNCVLDLCAAPGGKSGQIAEALAGRGVLVANEPVAGRARVLASNLERLGAVNAIVANCRPDELAELLPGAFSAVLVDAPCSGEGMFRKDPVAVAEWSLSSSEACARRQAEILKSADALLQEGGTLVYSTCTFSVRENEGVLLDFLKTHDYAPLPLALPPGASPGVGMEAAVRAYPHKLRGEGHFCCALKKLARAERASTSALPGEPVPKALLREAEAQLADLGVTLSGVPRLVGSRLCYVPERAPFARGMRFVSAGLTAFDAERARLTPYHSLAVCPAAKASRKVLSFPLSSAEASAYLTGQELSFDAPFTGWGFLAADGFPLGLIKASGGALKNHYPKGLRNLPLK